MTYFGGLFSANMGGGGGVGIFEVAFRREPPEAPLEVSLKLFFGSLLQCKSSGSRKKLYTAPPPPPISGQKAFFRGGGRGCIF